MAASTHGERLRNELSRITLPVLILHGTDCRGSEFFHRTAGSADKTLELYPGHYHDLLDDLGKEEVIAQVSGWIHERVPSVSEWKQAA